ncbi:MAG: hypothetical protein PHE27_05750 [Alphaproteobacteria bacterium]|nr:hypothetical protein [Alphaproteobacteria bacterium]
MAIKEDKDVSRAVETFLAVVGSYAVFKIGYSTPLTVAEELGDALARKNFSKARQYYEKLALLATKASEGNKKDPVYKFATKQFQKYESFMSGSCFEPGSPFGGADDMDELADLLEKKLFGTKNSSDVEELAKDWKLACKKIAEENSHSAPDRLNKFCEDARDDDRPDLLRLGLEQLLAYARVLTDEVKDAEKDRGWNAQFTAERLIRAAHDYCPAEDKKRVLEAWGELVIGLSSTEKPLAEEHLKDVLRKHGEKRFMYDPDISEKAAEIEILVQGPAKPGSSNAKNGLDTLHS